jgi:hypothetical protein
MNRVCESVVEEERTSDNDGLGVRTPHASVAQPRQNLSKKVYAEGRLRTETYHWKLTYFTNYANTCYTFTMSDPSRPAPPAPTIDLLLNLIDTRPQSILTSLSQHPQLASASDAHGYSLVHASVSYNQLNVLRTLINEYKADVNILDEDSETPLFAAEQADVARVLVEELGADWRAKNAENKTAEERIAEEEGENEVVLYLRSLRLGGPESANGGSSRATIETADVHPPPPLPNGVKVEVGTMAEAEMGDAPDPEIRRRIEELAAREDFQSEEGQRQLRELVTEVVTGMGAEDVGRNVRRRVD